MKVTPHSFFGLPMWFEFPESKEYLCAGQIFEVVSGVLEDPSDKDLFAPDDCLYRPLGGFREFDAALDSFATDRADDNPYMDGLTDEAGDDLWWTDESTYVSPGLPRFLSMVAIMPSHTSIATSDPTADAEYFVKYLGAVDPGSATKSTRARDGFVEDVTDSETQAWAQTRAPFKAVDAETCKVESKWLLFNTSLSSQPHYVRLAYHPEARPVSLSGSSASAVRQTVSLEESDGGVSMDLKAWEAYLISLRSDMGNNVYDVFMDDHLGVSIHSNGFLDTENFASVGLQLFYDDQPVLTRREPQPGDPVNFQEFGYEKFSMFMRLPVSQYPIQMMLSTSVQKALSDKGLPTEFCDWHFCDFSNYRSKTESAYLDADTCGFTDKEWLESL